MTAITTQAHARATKGPLFDGLKLNRKRYNVRLFIGTVDTGLTWRFSKRELAAEQAFIAEHAAEILEKHGLMDRVYAEIQKGMVPVDKLHELVGIEPATEPAKELALVGASSSATPFTKDNMPRPGQRVRLTRALGSIPAGTEGTVSRIDPWLDRVADAHQYPVRVALPHPQGYTPEIPLNLHEIEAA